MKKIIEIGNIRLTVDGNDIQKSKLINLILDNYSVLDGITFTIETINKNSKDNDVVLPIGNSLDPISIINSLPKHRNKVYSSRNLDRVKYLVVHHTADTTSSIESIANYHVNTKKWPGIGYHLYRDYDGKVYQTNHLTTKSYHAGEYNGVSIGVCIAGNFDVYKPSKEKEDKLTSEIKSIINWVFEQVGRTLEVVYHKDVRSTSCPGRYFPKIK